MLHDALDQALAFGRGAADSLPFGAVDRSVAGVQALMDGGGLDNLGKRFDAHMAQARAQDAYDAQHYALARAGGQIAGTGAQLLALGPLDGMVVGGRIAEAAPMIAREGAVLAGAGGAAGVGSQAASDLASHKLSSPADYAASGLGGAVDALASTRFGARTGGAAGGATTSMAKDLLNGRPISIGDAAQSTAAGGDLAGLAGLGGRLYANALPIVTKGHLGELLSKVRTRARFDATLPGPKSRMYLQNGKYIYPDSRTVGGDIVESKFGLTAKLSKNQQQAHDQGVPGFRVDHFLPQDIGAALAVPMGLLGYHASRAASGPSAARPSGGRGLLTTPWLPGWTGLLLN